MSAFRSSAVHDSHVSTTYLHIASHSSLLLCLSKLFILRTAMATSWFSHANYIVSGLRHPANLSPKRRHWEGLVETWVYETDHDLKAEILLRFTYKLWWCLLVAALYIHFPLFPPIISLCKSSRTLVASQYSNDNVLCVWSSMHLCTSLQQLGTCAHRQRKRKIS